MSKFIVAPFVAGWLIVLGVLVAGVILLVVLLRGKKLWWVLGISGAIAAVLVVVAAMFFYDMPYERARHVRRDMAATVSVRERAAPAAVDTSAFLADVYPSSEQAVCALATRLTKSTAGILEPNSQPVLRVMGQAPAGLEAQVAQILRRGLPASEVRFGKARTTERSIPPGVPKAVCGLQVDRGEQGRAQLALSGPGGHVTRSARFVTKPWAANFARFMGESSKSWILAESRSLAPSMVEAEQTALDDAAAQLLARLRDSIERGIAAGQFAPGARPVHGELRQLIVAELRRGNLLTDRFTQRFRRPYGDVWKQSMLVDCSPAGVDKVAGSIMAQTAGQRNVARSRWVRTATSIGGLAVLIFVVYLVLNAATKGYYVWVLRLAAIAVLATGAAAVLWFLSEA